MILMIVMVRARLHSSQNVVTNYIPWTLILGLTRVKLRRQYVLVSFHSSVCSMLFAAKRERSAYRHEELKTKSLDDRNPAENPAGSLTMNAGETRHFSA